MNWSKGSSWIATMIISLLYIKKALFGGFEEKKYLCLDKFRYMIFGILDKNLKKWLCLPNNYFENKVFYQFFYLSQNSWYWKLFKIFYLIYPKVEKKHQIRSSIFEDL